MVVKFLSTVRVAQTCEGETMSIHQSEHIPGQVNQRGLWQTYLAAGDPTHSQRCEEGQLAGLVVPGNWWWWWWW